MATYGLTTEGFLIKTLDVIRNDINTSLQGVFGSSIRVDDQSILGQIVGIIAERMALLWELAEAVNSSQDPDAASGFTLEQLCLLTGTLRPPATYSAVTLTLTGTPTTVVPSGSKCKTASTSVEFATAASATIAAATAWAATTAYAVGDRRTVNGHVYQCYTAGTSDVTGPVAEPPDFLTIGGSPQAQNDIVDGTVKWVYIGEGTGVVDVLGAASATGPATALAYDLSVIVNSLSGWDSVCNLSDATLGRNIATDAELRLLREQELATGGSATINALRAELLAVAGTLSVTIFENNTDTTDIDGIPPHSVEAMVRGPSPTSAAFDQLIFDALLAGVAAGIRTHGSVVGAALDDQLTSHVMKFTRPTEIPIKIVISVIKDPDSYPADGDTQIKTAITTWGDAQVPGKNAVASRIAAAAFEVAGVLEVSSCLLAISPTVPTSGTSIPISLRELATYDSSDITVISVDGTP